MRPMFFLMVCIFLFNFLVVPECAIILKDHDSMRIPLMVPEDYPTIQAAVDSASHGDIISIAPGTYYENIFVMRKSLSLVSRKGPGKTVLDGGQRDCVLWVMYPEGWSRSRG